MATYEHNILQQYKDSNGDIHVLYSVTKAGNVAGIEEYALKEDVKTKLETKASYEVGTFSPRFIGSPAATETRARYIKIGRIVHIFMSFEFTTAVKVNTGLGGKIIALPFAISDSQPTHGYYPASVKVNGGNYGGLAMYENHMETSPAISLSNITEDNETKIVRVCGQYETNA